MFFAGFGVAVVSHRGLLCAGGDVMDDADLEAEFDALGEEILDEQLMEISAPGVSVPASADPVVDAPQPAAAAAAPASAEDDELAQLEASMAM